MKRITLLLIGCVVLMAAAAAQGNQLVPNQPGTLEKVAVFMVSGVPEGDNGAVQNRLDVIIRVGNVENTGRVTVNIKPKGVNNEVIVVVDVSIYMKDNVAYYKLEQGEQAFKLGTALVPVVLGMLSVEQIDVEVILFDKSGTEVSRKTS
jgi:hypothetical protein